MDLVITNGDTCIVDLVVSDRISDHLLILFRTCVKKPPTDSHWVTRRAWRRLSCDDFTSDILASRLCSDLNLLTTMSANELASVYREAMTDLLDRHCPSSPCATVPTCRRQGSTTIAVMRGGRPELRSDATGLSARRTTSEAGLPN